jgi:uncharacterized protein YtpQ (UPF0354 family)
MENKEMTLNLYRLTNGLGVYFVVATDPTAAQAKLYERLNRGDGYGFYEERKVSDIHLIAEQITEDSFGLSGKLKKLLL